MARRDTASVPVRHPNPRRASALLAGVLALALVACGPDDGRHLADPNPELTAVPVPPRPPAEIIDVDPPLQGIGPGGLTLTSADFGPGATMPRAVGLPVARPRPAWSGPTRRTAMTELALVVQDIDAEGVAQWIVTGIPAEAGRVRAGEAPERRRRAANSAGDEACASPCPTDGFAHRIVFTLYALDQPLARGRRRPHLGGHRRAGRLRRLGQPPRPRRPRRHRTRLSAFWPRIPGSGHGNPGPEGRSAGSGDGEARPAGGSTASTVTASTLARGGPSAAQARKVSTAGLTPLRFEQDRPSAWLTADRPARGARPPGGPCPGTRRPAPGRRPLLGGARRRSRPVLAPDCGVRTPQSGARTLPVVTG